MRPPSWGPWRFFASSEIRTRPKMEAIITTVIEAVFGMSVFFYLYFLPTIIAYRRGHHNRGSIATINTVFGWTILGWVIALSMANSGIRRDMV
jgi:hypothetical protein